MLEQLRRFTSEIATMQNPEEFGHFTERDAFLGFDEDTLPSLVVQARS